MENTKTLPRFRKDLTIYTGPLEIDGSPTYNIYDPVRGQFFKISWKESLIFKVFTTEMGADELAKRVTESFPVQITAEDVNFFFAQASMLGLLRIPQDGQKLYERHEKAKGSYWYWFLQNYLFLRIPIFRPDAFLTKTLPYVQFLGSKIALTLYAVVIALGFFLLVNRLDQFFHTFSYYFNLEGILIYGCVLTAVKCIHELSHAYTAKNFGLYVPTMGVAFLVLWPVLYTDVTEGWKLRSRKERFCISFAGVAAELVMAGFATFGWILSSPGIVHSLCFLIASTSWFLTILININPAVRFDGYYILSDLWGIDNLMSRAFEYTRWQFHKTFFGTEAPCPESNISSKRAAGLVLYTTYTLIYRFFLYTAIALFVYYEFTKIIGITLFAAEIWIFFLMPVVWEVQALYRNRAMLTLNFRSVLTTAVFSLIAIWFFLPFPHDITLPGVIVPYQKQVIYAPVNGKIVEISAQNGAEVDAGASLIQLQSEDLNLQIAQNKKDEQILQNELLALSHSPENHDKIAAKQAELAQNEELRSGLLNKEDQLNVRASQSGTLIYWNPLLLSGQYVHEGEIFGTLADPSKIQVIAFAKETEKDSLKVGQSAEIFFQSSHLKTWDAVIKNIDNKRTVELIYPSLASVYGGQLPVDIKKNHNALLLHDSYYAVTLDVENPGSEISFGSSVEMEARGPWRSYFVELIKIIYRAVFKESSF